MYGIGIRGDALIPAVLLAGLLTKFVVTFMTLRVFPPDVELTGDYRGILYGANASEEGATATSEPVTGSIGRTRIFKQRREPWTMEGLVLRGVVALMLLWAVWQLARPLIK